MGVWDCREKRPRHVRVTAIKLAGSAGILAGCPEGAFGSAGMMPAGQPPGRRRYNRHGAELGLYRDA